MSEWLVECPACQGAGEFVATDHSVSRWADPGTVDYVIPCQACEGTGRALVRTSRMTEEDFAALHMQIPPP